MSDSIKFYNSDQIVSVHQIKKFVETNCDPNDWSTQYKYFEKNIPPWYMRILGEDVCQESGVYRGDIIEGSMFRKTWTLLKKPTIELPSTMIFSPPEFGNRVMLHPRTILRFTNGKPATIYHRDLADQEGWMRVFLHNNPKKYNYYTYE